MAERMKALVLGDLRQAAELCQSAAAEGAVVTITDAMHQARSDAVAKAQRKADETGEPVRAVMVVHVGSMTDEIEIGWVAPGDGRQRVLVADGRGGVTPGLAQARRSAVGPAGCCRCMDADHIRHLHAVAMESLTDTLWRSVIDEVAPLPEGVDVDPSFPKRPSPPRPRPAVYRPPSQDELQATFDGRKLDALLHWRVMLAASLIVQ